MDIFAAAGLGRPDISVLSDEFLTEVLAGRLQCPSAPQCSGQPDAQEFAQQMARNPPVGFQESLDLIRGQVNDAVIGPNGEAQGNPCCVAGGVAVTSPSLAGL